VTKYRGDAAKILNFFYTTRNNYFPKLRIGEEIR